MVAIKLSERAHSLMKTDRRCSCHPVGNRHLITSHLVYHDIDSHLVFACSGKSVCLPPDVIGTWS